MRRIILVALCVGWLAGCAEKEISQLPTEILTAHGAWCWFADPRGVVDAGKTYVGWVNGQGAIQVGAYAHDTGELTTATLHPNLQIDDHANPALLVLPDGRLMVFYAPHSGRPMYIRTSLEPGDISAWGAARELGINTEGRRGYTYPNPMILSEEDDRIYLFWRGGNWLPNFATSADGGASWAEARTLIAGSGARPYIKFATDGKKRIHFAFTDGHPRKEPANSIYYAYYESGAFYRADGVLIKTMAGLPFAPSEADQVYDGADTTGLAWIWDIALDRDDRPVIVHSTHPAETDHRYRYARWTGERWASAEITKAGGWFPQTEAGKVEREPHYSGGIYLDHGDPSVVYLSRPVEGVFEIEQWITSDGGATWKTYPITSGSSRNNVRPFVPRGYAGQGPAVIWMEGEYIHYTRYGTRLAMKVAR